MSNRKRTLIFLNLIITSFQSAPADVAVMRRQNNN